MFEAPIVPDEFCRQPIEQFGMARPVALGSKILRGGHEPPPKILLPYPIYDDARDRGVLWIDQPFGESEPGWRSIAWNRVQYCGSASRNRSRRFVKITALENVRKPRLVVLGEDQCRRRRRPLIHLFIDLLVRFGKALLRATVSAEQFALLLFAPLVGRNRESP